MINARADNTNPIPSLRLLTLGGLTLVRMDAPVPQKILGAGKPAAMLAYLTTLPGRQAGREHLKDLLWSDLKPTSADHAFRQAIWLLRRRIGQHALMTDNGTLRLATSLRTDRDEFMAAVESADLDEAVRLYGGDYLNGVALPGALEHEHWADAERYRLRLIFLRTAEGVVRNRLEAGGFRDAVPLARRVRDTDPASERGWRLLIETLVSGGDLVSAEVESDGLERMLAADERDAEPATLALLARVRHRDQTEPGNADNLLVAELVGREREFSTIIEHWKGTQAGTGAHLHITAPAGLGKTRLLHDVHRRLRIAGARTVILRANPGDRSVPYSFAGDLAGALGSLPGASGVAPGLAAHLVALHPQLSGVFDVEAAQESGPDNARHRTLAVAELISAVAEDRPFALLIDDVHWIDTVSHQLIVSVLERCRHTPVLILTTARPTMRGSHAASRSQILSLSPLETQEIADLIASVATTPATAWAERLPEALHAATGGSPLLILEALQLASERGWLSQEQGAWRCDDPDALFEELARGGPLGRRIEALDADRQWTLLVLAVAGTPLDDRGLAQVSPNTATTECLVDLERRGLVAREPAGWTVAHDELAETAIHFTSHERRQAAHLAMGAFRASASSSGALTQAADHFIQAHREDRLSDLLKRRLSLARQQRESISLRRTAAVLLGPHSNEERLNRLIRTLPAHVTWRYSRIRMGIAAVLVGAMLLAGMLTWQPDPPPADAVLTITRPEADGTIEAYDLAFHAESWNIGTPLADLTEAPLQPYTHDIGRDVLTSPDGSRWIVERPTSDSGGIDLFLPTSEGEIRLTDTPGDDKLPLWSPDGSRVVFHTARWNANSWYDLVTMDMETHEIRRLTRSNGQDMLGAWSPDGSRIAFYRHWVAEPRPGQICHIASDGTDEQCYDPIDGAWFGAAGWYDPNTIIAVVDTDGRQQLAFFDLEQRVVTHLPITLHDRGAVSPDGRWLLCHCVAAGDDRLRWLIVPTDRPRDARHVLDGESAPYNMRWRRGALPPRYVDSLFVRVPISEIPLETRHRLVAEGFAPNGERAPMGPVRWTVDDPTIATIDDDGVIHPLREGVVRVRASLGGWREASATVRIVPAAYQIVFRENWTADWETRWRPFGEPRPERREGPNGIWGLWNAGDGSFSSGAYRHLAIDVSQGVGFDVALSTPLTDLHWQTAYVEFQAASDTSWYQKWDHRTQNMPGLIQHVCTFVFPAAEGHGFRDRFRASAGVIDERRFKDPTLHTGNWYTVRVQILPDGRCGVALNGVAKWVSDHRIPTDVPYRLTMNGNSKNTEMLVGPLEVWEGVRPGIDWSAVQKDQ